MPFPHHSRRDEPAEPISTRMASLPVHQALMRFSRRSGQRRACRCAAPLRAEPRLQAQSVLRLVGPGAGTGAGVRGDTSGMHRCHRGCDRATRGIAAPRGRVRGNARVAAGTLAGRRSGCLARISPPDHGAGPRGGVCARERGYRVDSVAIPLSCVCGASVMGIAAMSSPSAATHASVARSAWPINSAMLEKSYDDTGIGQSGGTT